MAITNYFYELSGNMLNSINQLMDPATRERLYKATSSFAHQRPFLFFFFVSHLIFSTTPILLFISFVVSTFLFSIATATIFTLFWVIIAVTLLVAMLFVSFSVGMAVWVWCVSGFLAARWAYRLYNGKNSKNASVGAGNKIEAREKNEGKNDANKVNSTDYQQKKDDMKTKLEDRRDAIRVKMENYRDVVA
ncbi:Bgt-615 [Blumeria graminis f. sp. tritici]|uniref:Bgt-615 n=2 Tax=Blumeria graminis f. sp. tritici TaxID=62690 RepID=A0A9X9LAX8_BLUGR|nr:hypothetical protein BGT96224_615 [Blumeria graminis f. sp. tritici 96224]VCU41076.1 Bgt-615 [Blumeria graminis f. sp. tritici]